TGPRDKDNEERQTCCPFSLQRTLRSCDTKLMPLAPPGLQSLVNSDPPGLHSCQALSLCSADLPA
ncbi:Hypothetical predicted protein, partial [Marmota monax]